MDIKKGSSSLFFFIYLDTCKNHWWKWLILIIRKSCFELVLKPAGDYYIFILFHCGFTQVDLIGQLWSLTLQMLVHFHVYETEKCLKSQNLTNTLTNVFERIDFLFGIISIFVRRLLNSLRSREHGKKYHTFSPKTSGYEQNSF